MQDNPLRTDTTKKNKKKRYIWLSVIVLGALLIAFFGKSYFFPKADVSVGNKTELIKKNGKVDPKNTSGKKLSLVLAEFTDLYSDTASKTFRTDIKQSEIDDLKKLISELNNEDLKKEFSSDLEKVKIAE